MKHLLFTNRNRLIADESFEMVIETTQGLQLSEELENDTDMLTPVPRENVN